MVAEPKQQSPIGKGRIAFYPYQPGRGAPAVADVHAPAVTDAYAPAVTDADHATVGARQAHATATVGAECDSAPTGVDFGQTNKTGTMSGFIFHLPRSLLRLDLARLLRSRPQHL